MTAKMIVLPRAVRKDCCLSKKPRGQPSAGFRRLRSGATWL